MPGPALVILAAGLGQRFGGVKQLAPVGPTGEAILDYSARDALAAGFTSVVLIVRSEIATAVADHVHARWPPGLEVTFFCQDRDRFGRLATAAGRTKPLGTAHAVVAAAPALKGSFAVINADDLYGAEPFATLAAHFAAGGSDSLVAFEVAKSFVGDRPVRRALCEVDAAGHLQGVEEGTVAPDHGGLVWVGRSGRQVVLTGGEPVSMNFWGFGLDTLAAIDDAVKQFVAGGGLATDEEVLLPDVVRALVARPDRAPFTVLTTPERCLGVTHGEDLALLRAAVRDPAW